MRCELQRRKCWLRARNRSNLETPEAADPTDFGLLLLLRWWWMTPDFRDVGVLGSDVTAAGGADSSSVIDEESSMGVEDVLPSDNDAVAKDDINLLMAAVCDDDLISFNIFISKQSFSSRTLSVAFNSMAKVVDVDSKDVIVDEATSMSWL
jgi:hypothetical protein